MPLQGKSFQVQINAENFDFSKALGRNVEITWNNVKKSIISLSDLVQIIMYSNCFFEIFDQN